MSDIYTVKLNKVLNVGIFPILYKNGQYVGNIPSLRPFGYHDEQQAINDATKYAKSLKKNDEREQIILDV